MYKAKSFRFWESVSLIPYVFKYFISVQSNVYLMGCITLVLAGACFAFPLSYVMKNNVLIGAALIPFVFYANDRQRFNYFYLICVLISGFLAFYYEIRICYFFAMALFILFLTELLVGTVDKLVLFLLIFMSPFFQILAVIIGFPIRLKLSAWAGNLLTLIGFDVQVQGNMMLMNGSSFSVDDACMGLNMLAFSLLFGVFALAYQSKQTRLRISIAPISLFFFSVFVFDVLCNLLRILILVFFKIPAENPMHEIIGLLCFALYVILPIHFLSKWIIRKYGKGVSSAERISPFTRTYKLLISTLAFGLLVVGIHIYFKKETGSKVSHVSAALPGFKTEKMKDGITQLSNEQLLIYLKPIPEFFTAEHTPLICWMGSGFHFEGIRKKTIKGHEVYVGELVNEGQSLYTAWWYSNGDVQTIDQFDWRFRMMKGEEKFSLVNMTANDEATLEENINRMLQVSRQLNYK